jgi:hypothetical protein
MALRGIKKALIEDVEKLSPGQQKKLRDFARALLVSRPAGARGTDLLRFSGTFDKKSIRQMKEAVAECETVDQSEW